MADVVGLDLSLAKTGLCDGVKAWRRGYSLTEDSPLAAKVDRIRDVASDVVSDVLDARPRLVVVEQLSYGSQGDAVHQLAGLWFTVVGELQYARIPYATATPNQRAQYATGSGSAKKRAVKMAVRLRWPQIPVADDNEADAVSLAAMGLHWLGQRLDTTPVETLDGLAPWMDAVVAAVRWPDLSTR